MHLYVSLIPPEQTRADLAAIVDNVRLADEGAGRLRRGPLTLLRRGTATAERTPVRGMLHALPSFDLRIDLTGFGNLSKGDAVRLVEALGEEARYWSPFRLRIAGGAALEWPGDQSVWARLECEGDQLTEIAKQVPDVAAKLQLFVDRRRFRPMLKLGTITELTTAPYLEQLIADLDAYRGQWWDQTSLPLWQLLQGDGRSSRLRLHAEVPLGI